MKKFLVSYVIDNDEIEEEVFDSFEEANDFAMELMEGTDIEIYSQGTINNGNSAPNVWVGVDGWIIVDYADSKQFSERIEESHKASRNVGKIFESLSAENKRRVYNYMKRLSK